MGTVGLIGRGGPATWSPPTPAASATLRALWRLSRPGGALWIVLLPLFGYGFGHWDYALDLRHPAALGRLLAAWAALHAGTLWYNARLDAGEGAVLFGEPVPLPPRLGAWVAAAFSACLVLAWSASPGAGLCATGCVLLSVAYSHPAIRWKGHPVAGPAVNVLGYGYLSPLAGLAAADIPWTPRTLVTLTLATLWLLGLYFAAQAFQEADDRARGHRTLVAVVGPRTTLRVARACILAGDGLLVLLCAVGWYPRICLFSVGIFAWLDRLLRAWAAMVDGGTEAMARRLALVFLLGGLSVIGLAGVQYCIDTWQRIPPSGLGTGRGSPVDWKEER